MEVSEPLKVRDFVENWLKQQGMVDPLHSHSDVEVKSDLKEVLNVEEDVFNEISGVCSIKHLLCGEEPPNEFDMLKNIPENTELETLKEQKEAIHKRKTDGVYNQYFRKHKLKHLRFTPSTLVVEPSPDAEIISRPDTLLTVRFYRPYMHYVIKIDQEYAVLGSTLLTSLRDKLRCVHDIGVPGEYSERPDDPHTVRTRDLYKGGFFFIESCFYNDTREPTALDYSKVIADWASDPQRQVGPFSTCAMEGATFGDLTLRIGQPYVYQHQGQCEHIFVFTDVRLLDADDCLVEAEYPRLTAKSRLVRTVCRVCLRMTAKWVIRECEVCPEDPCFMCEVCFKMLCYTKDNQKVTDFKAYPYYDGSAVY